MDAENECQAFREPKVIDRRLEKGSAWQIDVFS